MSERKPISKRLRFEIFKRDGFVCQYCGGHPPDAVLEIDHISPVANGGDNSMDNLVTSCFDCNRGKGKIELSVVPQNLKDKAAAIQEREEQIAGYRAIMQAQVEREEKDCWAVVEVLFPVDHNDGIRKDWFHSIKTFIRKLDIHSILEAAEIALARKPYSNNQRFRYFCGICWNKITDNEVRSEVSAHG